MAVRSRIRVDVEAVVKGIEQLKDFAATITDLTDRKKVGQGLDFLANSIGRLGRASKNVAVTPQTLNATKQQIAQVREESVARQALMDTQRAEFRLLRENRKRQADLEREIARTRREDQSFRQSEKELANERANAQELNNLRQANLNALRSYITQKRTLNEQADRVAKSQTVDDRKARIAAIEVETAATKERIRIAEREAELAKTAINQRELGTTASGVARFAGFVGLKAKTGGIIPDSDVSNIAEYLRFITQISRAMRLLSSDSVRLRSDLLQAFGGNQLLSFADRARQAAAALGLVNQQIRNTQRLLPPGNPRLLNPAPTPRLLNPAPYSANYPQGAQGSKFDLPITALIRRPSQTLARTNIVSGEASGQRTVRDARLDAARQLFDAEREKARIEQIRKAQAQLFADVRKNFTDTLGLAERSNTSIGSLIGSFVKWYAAIQLVRAGFAAVRNIIEQSLGSGAEYVKTIESARVGIATLVAGQYELRDAQGNVLQGQAAFQEAMQLSSNLLKVLEVQSFRTGIPLERLAVAFQEGAAAGAAAGLSLEQTAVLVSRITAQARAANIPLTQLNEEVRSLLSGTATRNTRLANVLFGSPREANKQINAAKAKGPNELFNLINSKTNFAEFAGLAQLQTAEGVLVKLQSAIRRFFGEMETPAFEKFKELVRDILPKFIQFRDSSGNIIKGFGLEELQKIASIETPDALKGLQQFGSNALVKGLELAADLITRIFNTIEAISKEIENNPIVAQQVIGLLGEVYNLFIDFIGLLGDIFDSGDKNRTTLEAIRDILVFTVTVVQALFFALQTVLGVVLGLIGAVSKVLGFLIKWFDPIRFITRGLSAVASVLAGLVSLSNDFYKILFQIATLDFSGAADTFSNSFDKAIDSAKKAFGYFDSLADKYSPTTGIANQLSTSGDKIIEAGANQILEAEKRKDEAFNRLSRVMQSGKKLPKLNLDAIRSGQAGAVAIPQRGLQSDEDGEKTQRKREQQFKRDIQYQSAYNKLKQDELKIIYDGIKAAQELNAIRLQGQKDLGQVSELKSIDEQRNQIKEKYALLFRELQLRKEQIQKTLTETFVDEESGEKVVGGLFTQEAIALQTFGAKSQAYYKASLAVVKAKNEVAKVGVELQRLENDEVRENYQLQVARLQLLQTFADKLQQGKNSIAAGQAELLGLQGNTSGQQIAEVQNQFDQRRVEINQALLDIQTKFGADSPQGRALIAQQRELLEIEKQKRDLVLQRIKFEQSLLPQQIELTRLETEKVLLGVQQSDATLTQIEYEEQLRLKTLEILNLEIAITRAKIANAQQTLAEGVDKEKTIAELEKQLAELLDAQAAAGITRAQSIAREAGRSINLAFQDGIRGFVDDVLFGTESISDAFKKMASNILKTIADLALNKLLQSVFKAIGLGDENGEGGSIGETIAGAIFGKGSDSGSSGGSGAEGIFGEEFEQKLSGFFKNFGTKLKDFIGKAGGFFKSIIGSLGSFFGKMGFADGGSPARRYAGLVHGSGTTKSDSIPAFISNREYVVDADTVQRWGIDFFDSLKYANATKLATGGMANHIAKDAPATVAANSLRILNILDPSMVPNYLRSAEGRRTILNILSEERGSVSQMLA